MIRCDLQNQIQNGLEKLVLLNRMYEDIKKNRDLFRKKLHETVLENKLLTMRLNAYIKKYGKIDYE